jgi:hypothetical protein
MSIEMHSHEWQQIERRWFDIVTAIDAAGTPLDSLSLLAVVAGARALSGAVPRPEKRPIGFTPAGKESR